MAIDAIYSIGAHLTNEILNHKEEILKCLNQCKTDKSQPVRAAAQETIKLIKDLDVNRSFDDELDDGPLGEIEPSQHEFRIETRISKDIISDHKHSIKTE